MNRSLVSSLVTLAFDNITIIGFAILVLYAASQIFDEGRHAERIDALKR